MEQVANDLHKNKDALLNEYKGSLFEFLVAKKIASLYDLEINFLDGLHNDLFALFSQQEDYLRNYFPAYLTSLPELALHTATELKIKLGISKIDNVMLSGRNRARSIEQNGDETDLILLHGKKETNISLKLSKKGSFTNTKSAGVKSFFSKYFPLIDPAVQIEFTRFYEQEFIFLAIRMFEAKGLEYFDTFKGWEESGYPVLPGELDKELKKILREFYELINGKIYFYLEEELKKSKHNFLKCLLPLMGFSREDLFQMTTYYNVKNSSIVYHQCDIYGIGDLELNENEICLKKNETSLEIKIGEISLQLRLKPMNKFIHSSYKINCAVKIS